MLEEFEHCWQLWLSPNSENSLCEIPDPQIKGTKQANTPWLQIPIFLPESYRFQYFWTLIYFLCIDIWWQILFQYPPLPCSLSFFLSPSTKSPKSPFQICFCFPFPPHQTPTILFPWSKASKGAINHSNFEKSSKEPPPLPPSQCQSFFF